MILLRKSDFGFRFSFRTSFKQLVWSAVSLPARGLERMRPVFSHGIGVKGDRTTHLADCPRSLFLGGWVGVGWHLCGSSGWRLRAGECCDPKLVEIVAPDVIDIGEEGVEVVVDGQVPSGQRVGVAGGDAQDQVGGPGWVGAVAVRELLADPGVHLGLG